MPLLPELAENLGRDYLNTTKELPPSPFFDKARLLDGNPELSEKEAGAALLALTDDSANERCICPPSLSGVIYNRSVLSNWDENQKKPTPSFTENTAQLYRTLFP
ncbi:MAG: hypothetical protein VKJ06_09410 [Vampirovibrionales bacterium]|nr:hypothetical protein [Vampirovibrionales bacterium]